MNSQVIELAGRLPKSDRWEPLRRRIQNDCARFGGARWDWLAGISYAELRDLLDELDRHRNQETGS